MRSEARAPSLADQRVISLRLLGEYACAFLGHGPTLDSVEMLDPRVSGKTRENCRRGVRFRPVDEFDQALPSRAPHQGERRGGCARW